MKKYPLNPKYKKFHRSSGLKSQRNTLRRRGKTRSYSGNTGSLNSIVIREPVEAPKDSRLLENTGECLRFIYNLRRQKSISVVNRKKFVMMTLKNVVKLDYSFVSILTALADDLKSNGVTLRGDFPKNKAAEEYLKESGFLNRMYNEKGERMSFESNSDQFNFEKGFGKWSELDSQRIAKISKKVNNHLTKRNEYCQFIQTIMLEICANSIEWSKSTNKQWVLGVKYETNRVIFTVTDLGVGILSSLYRRYGQIISDTMRLKSKDEILLRAFQKKYGSTSKKTNRNKGLPCIKNNFDLNRISELKVITNGVVLDFSNHQKSRTFINGSVKFSGTFYRWIVDKKGMEIN